MSRLLSVSVLGVLILASCATKPPEINYGFPESGIAHNSAAVPVKDYETVGIIFVKSTEVIDSAGNHTGSKITYEMLMREAQKLNADDVLNIRIDVNEVHEVIESSLLTSPTVTKTTYNYTATALAIRYTTVVLPESAAQYAPVSGAGILGDGLSAPAPEPDSVKKGFVLPEFRLSAGGGGYFTSDFGGGVDINTPDVRSLSVKTPYVGAGAFAFFDATYGEVSLGFFGGGGTWKEEHWTYGDGPAVEVEDGMSVSGLDIGVLAKYPFTLNEKLSLFPLLGITYRIMLSVKATDNEELWYSGDDAKNFNALWFKFGGGLDFSFTQQIYLRGEAAYGMRLANDKEQHMGDDDPVSVERDQKQGHGLEIKIAAGYRI